MSESTAEVAHTLLAEAAKAAEAAGADSIGVGDVKRYLEAYYKHVPAEDLQPAGPLRAGMVAAEHARAAARRPQGRALVQVHAAGESAALEESRGVVDIVTDDMPFLVDSITNELARHNLDSYHIVHPQLVVRRDVSGELREVVGPPGAPVLRVNPMSALAPGLVRKVFEFPSSVPGERYPDAKATSSYADRDR